MTWAHCENVTPGNRWLRWVFATDTDLSDESRQEVYQKYLKVYSERDGSQL